MNPHEELEDLEPKVLSNFQVKKGRPADEAWTYFTKISDKKYECIYCHKTYHSPVSVALRGHFSNKTYARKYKTTLCPVTTPEVDEIKDKFTKSFMTKDALNKESATSDVDTSNNHTHTEIDSNIINDERMRQIIRDFFVEFNIPDDAMNSPQFHRMLHEIKNGISQKLEVMQYLDVLLLNMLNKKADVVATQYDKANT